jgi:hypothetical protein
MAKNKTNKDKQEAALQKPQIPDKSETTYVLVDAYNTKQETKKTTEAPPDWFKPIAEIKEKTEKYKTFVLWQAAAIAHAVFELANWIEAVGDKKSTLNKIDALRKAIVYTNATQIHPKLKDGQANLKLTEFNDLLLKILEEILPYYKSVNKKPVPAKTVVNLKKLAEQLQQFAGEYKEHAPLEAVTNEMRQLADDIPHYNYPDICLSGKASGISFLLGAIVYDLYESKKLTEDEIQVKSYLSQSMNLLNEFSAKRSWPKEEKEQLLFKTKISEDIIHFANQLDKSPIIKQYQVFSQILSGTEDQTDRKQDKSENNSMKSIGENLFQTEKEYRERIESFPVFGQKSNFVRSILNESLTHRTDIIGILLKIFSPGRFIHLYWEHYGLPDLAKEFAELDIDNRFVILKKTLTKDECNQVIIRVNEVFLVWQAWRKQALQNGIEDLRKKKMDKEAKLAAWIDWMGAHEDLKSQFGDIGIYELREYLENIAVEIDKRESELSSSEIIKDNKKATIDNKEASTEEIINLDEDELELLNWFNDQYPGICYVKRYPKRDDKTKYNYARNLENRGMIRHPAGKTRGHVITEKGRKFIEKYYS